MRNVLLLALTSTLAIAGCLKPDAAIHGALSVSGTVTDKTSGTPVSGTTVTLSGRVQKKGPIGYLSEDELLATDTTDASGAYSFEYEARSETGYEVHVLPSDRYLEQALTAGKPERMTGAGKHTRDISCVRTAFVAVTLRNVAPVDTAQIALIGPVGRIDVSRLHRDTLLRLRIYGDQSASLIVLNKDGSPLRKEELRAGPGDTVQGTFEY